MISIMWRIYQRIARLWRCSAFEFSDNTASINLLVNVIKTLHCKMNVTYLVRCYIV
jgi:hypothetical protein